MAEVHIHTSPPVEKIIARSDCVICGWHSFSLIRFYEWYDPTSICMKCGSRWEGKELMTSPTSEIWKRKKRVEEAKRWWRDE